MCGLAAGCLSPRMALAAGCLSPCVYHLVQAAYHLVRAFAYAAQAASLHSNSSISAAVPNPARSARQRCARVSCVRVFICLCVCVCKHVCAYLCVYVNASVCVNVCACVHIFVFVCLFVWCACICACMRDMCVDLGKLCFVKSMAHARLAAALLHGAGVQTCSISFLCWEFGSTRGSSMCPLSRFHLKPCMRICVRAHVRSFVCVLRAGALQGIQGTAGFRGGSSGSEGRCHH